MNSSWLCIDQQVHTACLGSLLHQSVCPSACPPAFHHTWQWILFSRTFELETIHLINSCGAILKCIQKYGCHGNWLKKKAFDLNQLHSCLICIYFLIQCIHVWYVYIPWFNAFQVITCFFSLPDVGPLYLIVFLLLNYVYKACGFHIGSVCILATI